MENINKKEAPFDTQSVLNSSAIVIIIASVFVQWIFLIVALPLSYFIYKGKKIALILSQIYLPIILLSSLGVFTETMRGVDGNLNGEATGNVATFFLFAFCFYIYLARRLWKVYKALRAK